jgi:hypothetical protein
MAHWYASYPTDIMSRIVNGIVSVIQIALGVRLALQLFAANSSAPFVTSIYEITQPLIAPFAGIFPAWTVGTFTLDLTTIFAMIAYAMLGWLVLFLFSLVLSVATPYEMYEYDSRARDL